MHAYVMGGGEGTCLSVCGCECDGVGGEGWHVLACICVMCVWGSVCVMAGGGCVYAYVCAFWPFAFCACQDAGIYFALLCQDDDIFPAPPELKYLLNIKTIFDRYPLVCACLRVCTQSLPGSS